MYLPIQDAKTVSILEGIIEDDFSGLTIEIKHGKKEGSVIRIWNAETKKHRDFFFDSNGHLDGTGGFVGDNFCPLN